MTGTAATGGFARDRYLDFFAACRELESVFDRENVVVRAYDSDSLRALLTPPGSDQAEAQIFRGLGEEILSALLR